MTPKPSRYIVVLISLLIFLLTGQAGVLGYVWCLGENGHSEFESVANKGCAATSPQQAQDCHDGKGALESHTQEDHCGTCLDIPACLDATSTRDQSQKGCDVSTGLASLPQISLSPIFAQVLTKNLLAQPPPRVSQTILAHRTVVLLN